MKFSEISKEQWDELQPYLDTCLLPVTGMNGTETPYEATEKLEKLRDMMDMVEGPFKGRVVTYPACHYATGESSMGRELDVWCARLKAAGFKYIILITADWALSFQSPLADLVLQPKNEEEWPDAREVSSQIRALWERKSP
ncbi:DUF2487 family protein [Paenibacillus sp. GCM10027627]|uniref:DUF2487 family protein n=1 Tax=unclassified Paenibacillus TaxID=185978 RepID=UPI003625DE62